MRFDEVAEAIAAVANLIRENGLTVIGSQAIYAVQPDLDESIVLRSDEIDVYLGEKYEKDREEALYYFMHEHLGCDSEYHEKHGFYVDAVRKGLVPILPTGWRDRAIVQFFDVRSDETNELRKVEVRFLEPHDLVLSKLVAGREKDYEFAKMAIRKGYVRKERLEELAEHVPVDVERRKRIRDFIHVTFMKETT